jgi:hypothetical protein
MNESMTEVATTTFVVREGPAGGAMSVDWEGNRFSLGKRALKNALKFP